jgi:hypothetical protein
VLKRKWLARFRDSMHNFLWSGHLTSSASLLLRSQFLHVSFRTEKKEKKIFLKYKEIQSGAVAKSFMRKGFLINEDMRKYFPIYKGAVIHI